MAGEVYFSAARPADRMVITETGDALTEYVPSLDENRLSLHSLTKLIHTKALTLGCWTPLGLMDSTPAARENLTLHFVTAPDDTGWAIDWTMLDNSVVSHTKAQLGAALAAVAAFHRACHDRAKVVKDAIFAATTQTDLDAIDPTQDWPDIDQPMPSP